MGIFPKSLWPSQNVLTHFKSMKFQWSKSAISIGIPKLNFKFQLISIHQLHCTLHSCQIARAATVDWIGAFLKCKPSYLMRGIKSVRRKMMIAWIYPKIAKSASVILVEEVASLTKEIRQCQECLLSWQNHLEHCIVSFPVPR